MNAKDFMPVAAAFALVSCGQPAGNEHSGTAAEAVNLTIPAGEYDLEKNHALLQFSISHLGLSNYTSRFGAFDGTITLDPQNIDRSRVAFSVRPASISTLYPSDYKTSHANLPFNSWDEQLAFDPAFFNARKFPVATFVSTKVEKSGPRNAKVTGDFNLLGVTKQVTFDVALVGQVQKHILTRLPAFGVRAEGRIMPSDFGIKGPLAPNPVTIVFDGEFHKKVLEEGPEGGNAVTAGASASASSSAR